MHCQECKGTENLLVASHTRNKNGTSSTAYICRACNAERARQYRLTAAGKRAARAAVVKYEAGHPERHSAWRAASKLELKPCEVCGEPKSHRHHPDPLDRLRVVFLCPPHHKAAHSVV